MKLMERYINKDTLMAEINKLKDKAYPNSDWNHGYVASCEKILSFLNALEAKEVDLEQEATEFVQTKEFAESNESPVLLIAKHFFELGLKAQMKTSLREKDDGKNT